MAVVMECSFLSPKVDSFLKDLIIDMKCVTS